MSYFLAGSRNLAIILFLVLKIKTKTTIAWEPVVDSCLLKETQVNFRGPALENAVICLKQASYSLQKLLSELELELELILFFFFLEWLKVCWYVYVCDLENDRKFRSRSHKKGFDFVIRSFKKIYQITHFDHKKIFDHDMIEDLFRSNGIMSIAIDNSMSI